jgi:hypothetical protein
MSAPAAQDKGPGAAALIEEAVHLLRAAPAAAWASYLAGTAPWLIGLAWFWASASWFAPRPAELLWQALLLAGLYVWLKTWQAAFGARLRAHRLGVPPPPLGPRELLRVARRQARVQGWAAPVLPVAGLLTVPAGVAWMYFENTTALAATDDPPGESLERRALREARRWPGPGHLALVYFSGLWLCAWINVASAFYVLPWLARTLLGVDNLFALSGWSALNSTFLALVTALAWLVVDPLVKAYHVLRTFYGEARLTGEDLRLELRRPRRATRAAARVALVVFAAWLALAAAPSAAPLRAQPAAQGPAPAGERAETVTPAELDRALDEALRGREFLWRLEPLPLPQLDGEGEGWIKAFVRAAVEWIGGLIRDLFDLLGRLKDWLDELLGKKKPDLKEKTPREPRDYQSLTRVLLYGLLAVCVLALLWLLWTGWRQQRRRAPRALAAMPAVALPPDLNDEKLEASRLPTDEWLALAREQMARGEWRLALRALYLATLAGLGARGLVTLARAKTNLDYERELARRAAGREEIVGGFRARRLAFERVWYGRDAAAEPELRAWLGELERERQGEGGAS